MLWRKYENEIKKCLTDEGKALLVDGARQVGKTYLIRKIAGELDNNFVEFNLIEQPDVAELLNRSGNVDDFIQRLNLISKKPIKEGSIIFFDEIQEADDVITMVKFLVDDGRYRYVFSGSLLGVELKSVRSAPVGYMHEVIMYPLDFFEFLTALGIQKNTMDDIAESLKSMKKLDNYIHTRLIELFHLYMIVGGMPQAVREYVESSDLNDVSSVHHDIVNLYKRDFTKYERKEKLKLIAIYDAIPSELNKQNKRFIFTYLNKQLKFDRYENSFLWLKDAGVAIPVYNARAAELPLIQSKSSNLFKLFMNDVGLLTSHYPNQVKLKILNNNRDINYGAIYENAVAQLLLANGTIPYYYKNSKVGEVDFIVEKDGACLPIEVKSGKNFRNHRALNHLLERKDLPLNEAYVLSNSELEKNGKISYVPIYMAGLIRDTEMEDGHIHIDLEGL